MSDIQEINEHLKQLRKIILRIAISVGIITMFLISFHAEPTQINGIQLYYPTPDPLNNIAAQIINYMKETLVPEDVQLIQTAPGQAFFAQIYVAALTGIALSMPIIIKESVGFIKPALKEKEIKISRNISLPALILFIVGCIFSYIFVIPYILDFLYTYGESAGLVTFLNVIDFVTFVFGSFAETLIVHFEPLVTVTIYCPCPLLTILPLPFNVATILVGATPAADIATGFGTPM